jgi:hypothetical protein
MSQLEKQVNDHISLMAKEEDRKQDKAEIIFQLNQFQIYTTEQLSDIKKLQKN